MRPLEIEIIRSEISQFTKRQRKAGQFGKVYDSGPDSGLLRTKPANQWMIQEYGTPAARSLFGSFWFEHELCILFADTNLGKSILAVQIGDNLTRGGCLDPFNNELEAGSPVLYIDFELSSKQFEARYVDHRWGSYVFAENFYRSEFNPEADDPIAYSSYDDYVKTSIGTAVHTTGAKVLIIDNITYMRTGTEQAKDALPLMKMLKALKAKYNLSVLVLAHTPKRNTRKPLTVNDLQGSKMLINFADSAFAIGQSHSTPGIRYLKQIKQRNKKEEYGEDNVCLIKQEIHLNFLRYKFEGFAREEDHLRVQNSDRQLQHHLIAHLYKKGQTCRQIADELGIHFSTVSRVVQRSKAEVAG
jgi:hypothetical protein